MVKSGVNHPNKTPVHDDGTYKHLKHLDFVQSAVIYMIVCFLAIYEFAKENSGPLRNGVQSVEDTVKTVVGPVYEKFQYAPFEVLMLADQKVDETLDKVNHHVPSLMKRASKQTMFAAQEAQEVARELTNVIQHHGVVNTATNTMKTMYVMCEPMAKEIYANYEPVARKYSSFICRSMSQLPLFPQVAHIVAPPVVYCASKYNNAVCYTVDKGYPVSRYLPLVPVKKMAKALRHRTSVPSDRRKITIVA